MKKTKQGAVTLQGLATTLGGVVMTVQELGEMLGFVIEHMATKVDIAELRGDVNATKDAVTTLQMQVNGIESELRGIRQARLEVRVADLEEKVFGRDRS